MAEDYYQLLGVAEDATSGEIKSAYRKKVLELHPDKNPDNPSVTDLFKQVVEANRVLSSPESRKNYDRRRNAVSIFNSQKFNVSTASQMASKVASNIGNILDEDFFDTLSKFLGKGLETKNIEIKVQISLEDLYNGADKEITYSRLEVCDKCKGRGAVNREDFKMCHACFGSGAEPSLASLFKKQECKICKGLGKIIINKCITCNGVGNTKKETNLIIPIPHDLLPTDRLIVPKEGQAEGDLIIQLEPEPHPYLEIVNDIDLAIELPITFYQAALGDLLEIDTLKGPAHFKLDEGTQSEDSRLLKGYGLKHGDKVGDLIIRFVVQIPKRLNKEQKELLEKFRDTDTKRSAKQKPKKRT